MTMKIQDQMKPAGAWKVRRRINIPALVHAADALAVEDAISALSGVRRVATDEEKHQVVVLYDARQTDFESIVEVLENTGFPPLDSWFSRLKGNWIQFTDTNARDNAKAPPPACCNKPPK